MKQHNPPHVGQIIKEVYFGLISKEDLSKKLNRSMHDVDLLLDGDIAITSGDAEVLSSVLGQSPESWLNIQKKYDESIYPESRENCRKSILEIEIANPCLTDIGSVRISGAVNAGSNH